VTGVFMIKNRLIILTGVMILILMAQPVSAKEKRYPRARVTAPFLEIHTGPGRHYPVFYIAEKNEEVFLMKKRTDWFKVRLFSGQEGWVHYKEIDKTIQASGYQKSWSERFYDNYIDGRLQAGWAWGVFDEDSAIYVRAAYRFTEGLSAETSLGFASGDFRDTNLYLAGLVITPWRSRWFSINGTIGGGLLDTRPDDILINVKNENFKAAYAGVGFSAPLKRRLALRGDFRNYTLFISPKRNREVREYSLGVIFGF